MSWVADRSRNFVSHLLPFTVTRPVTNQEIPIKQLSLATQDGFLEAVLWGGNSLFSSRSRLYFRS